jgi:hypothetical protein
LSAAARQELLLHRRHNGRRGDKSKAGWHDSSEHLIDLLFDSSMFRK